MRAPPLSPAGIGPDSLRRAIAEVFARPEYRWSAREPPLGWILRTADRLLAWLVALEGRHPGSFRIVFALLVLLLVGLLLHLASILWDVLRAPAPSPPGAPSRVGPEDRAGDCRAAADALARAGRYAEALVPAFAAAIFDLHERRALAFHPAKTPAEYVGEARLDAAGRASLAALVSEFYRHIFGARPCDESTYTRFASAAAALGDHVTPA